MRAFVSSVCLAAAAVISSAAAAETFDGADLFKKACATCHSVVKDDTPRQGPNLFAIFGRKAGTIAGFNYSPAFTAAASGITWDEADLDRWLTNPQAVIPGTTMLYKQGNAGRRLAVIAYLKSVK